MAGGRHEFEVTNDLLLQINCHSQSWLHVRIAWIVLILCAYDQTPIRTKGGCPLLTEQTFSMAFKAFIPPKTPLSFIHSFPLSHSFFHSPHWEPFCSVNESLFWVLPNEDYSFMSTIFDSQTWLAWFPIPMGTLGPWLLMASQEPLPCTFRSCINTAWSQGRISLGSHPGAELLGGTYVQYFI